MKRNAIIILLVFVVCNLSGCSFNLPNGRSIFDDSLGEEYAVNVMNCFINKDSETLESLFCTKVQNITNFDEQIQEAFKFIDGNILSYDKYISCQSGEAYDDGVLTDQHYSPIIEDITTDKGKTYMIFINIYIVYLKDNEKIGITSITIREDANHENYYRLGLK